MVTGFFDFDFEHIDREPVREWDLVVDACVCLLGRAPPAARVWLMAASGRAFALTEESLARLGSSGADAVEILCAGTATRTA